MLPPGRERIHADLSGHHCSAARSDGSGGVLLRERAVLEPFRSSADQHRVPDECAGEFPRLPRASRHPVDRQHLHRRPAQSPIPGHPPVTDNAWDSAISSGRKDGSTRERRPGYTASALRRLVQRVDVFACFLDIGSQILHDPSSHPPDDTWSFVTEQYIHPQIAKIGFRVQRRSSPARNWASA